MDFLKWASGRTLPKALQSRTGWTQLFEHYRTEEPHLHQIEPTNACPYACIMCPRNDNMSRKVGRMDMGLFRKVIDEVSTYSPEVREKEIELFHFGESLYHPDLPEMVDYTSTAGLRPTLSVNPAELNPKIIDRVLEGSPYKVIVSLDSMDSGRYQAIRGQHADLEKAVASTELLLGRHRDIGGSAIVIVRMIGMKMNEDEIEQFREFWESRGGVVELREFFPWNKKELQELGVVEKYPPFMPCPFAWQYVVVQWNGDVVPCCRDYNGELKLGNVAGTSLKEIWNGPAYTEFREKMATGNGLSEFCEECLSLYYQEQ